MWSLAKLIITNFVLAPGSMYPPCSLVLKTCKIVTIGDAVRLTPQQIQVFFVKSANPHLWYYYQEAFFYSVYFNNINNFTDICNLRKKVFLVLLYTAYVKLFYRSIFLIINSKVKAGMTESHLAYFEILRYRAYTR